MYRDSLREKKEKLGWTTEELSLYSGVPVGTINKILSGETASPRYDTIQALERAMSASYTEAAGKPLFIRETSAYLDSFASKEYTIEDYARIPQETRAELIDGQLFYMQSPTPAHQAAVTSLLVQSSVFIAQKKGTCQVFPAPLDVQLDCNQYTMLQPDFMIVCDKDKVHEDRIYGAPDFVAEVLSPSSKKMDTGRKLLKYFKAGVREYWVVDLDRRRVVCYYFEEEDLIPNAYTLEDEVPVRIFQKELCIRF
ncbi:MAG: Uma2 family endonuclease [Lachnospiraceae bacterium]|nr:Uma2 family endonuclease [Lachnospiraceae bacterium]